MKLSVVIDARKLGDGGIGTYIENLFDGLLEISPTLDFELNLTALLQTSLKLELPYTSPQISDALKRWDGRVNFLYDSSPKYSLNEHLIMPLRHNRELREASVFHSPHYTLPYFLNSPAVVTIHDVLHVTRPENVYQKFIGRRLINSACRRASKIITVSQKSYDELLKVSNGLSADAVVIPNALSPKFNLVTARKSPMAVASSYAGSSYLLFVGSDRPHKGLKLLLEAYLLLKNQSTPESFPRLLLVGERYSDWVKQFVENHNLKTDVIFLGNVSAVDLNALYMGAKAVVVPSIEEGFGLVVLEAISLQVPVVCSSISVFREISQSMWFAKDYTSESFATEINQVLNNPDAAKQKSLQAKSDSLKFSLSRVARETLNVYLSCVADDSNRAVENLIATNRQSLKEIRN